MTPTANSAKIRYVRARRRRRATAFAETAIMLPFLLIVFSSIVYLGRLYLARQQALLTARTCAWEYAYHSCATLPVGCPKELFTDHTDPPDSQLTDQINNAKAQTQGGASQPQGDAKTQNFVDKTGGYLGEMVDFVLGESTTASTVRTVKAPPVLSGAGGRAPASYFLACNTKERSPIQMAIDLFKALLPGL